MFGGRRDLGPGTRPEAPSASPPETGIAGVRAKLQAWRTNIGHLFDMSEVRRTDPMRPTLEILRDAPGLIADSVAAVADDAVGRIARAADLVKAAADAQGAAAEATIRARHAEAMADLAARLNSTVDAAVAADRRVRGYRALGTLCCGAALLIAAAGAAGYYAGRAHETQVAASSLDALRQQASATAASLAAGEEHRRREADDLARTVSEASTGLALMRTIGNLPQQELEAAQALVNDMAASVRGGPGSPASAIRDILALPTPDRSAALRFARTGNAALRQAVIGIAEVAAFRGGTPYWAGDTPPPGCVATGPAIRFDNGTLVATCLVQLPLGVTTARDTHLARHYQSQQARH